MQGRTWQRGAARRVPWARARLRRTLHLGRGKGGGGGVHGARREPPPAPRLQGNEHATPAQRDQIARDLSSADAQDWDDRFAEEEAEDELAEAADELGSFEDGMGEVNSYAFIAYEVKDGRLFIVEINTQSLQAVAMGQGRGTQCIHAAVTHLPEGVDPAEIETVDLHQHRDNQDAEQLYEARGFWEERSKGEMLYEVEDPPEGQEVAWLYKRRDYGELQEALSTHPKVVNPATRPEWEYFSSRSALETTSPHLWEIVKSMTERFHGGDQVRECGSA